jgi:hypothetical protein
VTDPPDRTRLFGGDPSNYHDARPEYPDRVYDLLTTRCGLGVGTSTLEIGPGTGLATHRLLGLGADPLVAVEPDARLAAFLSARLQAQYPALRVVVSPFEPADVPARASIWRHQPQRFTGSTSKRRWRRSRTHFGPAAGSHSGG